MAQLNERRNDTIRAIYDPANPQTSDYDEVYPVTTFENVRETYNPTSNNLKTMFQIKDNELNAKLTSKQNVIKGGTLNNILAYSGTEGLVGELIRTDSVNPDPLMASGFKIASERAVSSFHNDTIKPEIKAVTDALALAKTTLESGISATNEDLALAKNEINSLEQDLLTDKAALSQTDIKVSQIDGDVNVLKTTVGGWSTGILKEGQADSFYDVRQRVVALEADALVPSDFGDGGYTKKVTIADDGSGVIISNLRSNVNGASDSNTTTKIISSDSTVTVELNTIGSASTLDVKAAVTPAMVNAKVAANTPIVGGTFTKVVVDEKGLVTGNESLVSTDIPEIGQEKVTGLAAALASKAEAVSLTALETTVNTKADQTDLDALELEVDGKVTSNADIVAGSAVKVNFDAKGLVTGPAILEASDIPVIEISGVNGLTQALDAKASATDLETVSQNIEGKADTSALNALQQTVGLKLDANTTITAGVGTKISYDEKGLVTGSTTLSAADLPTLVVADINGLQSALDNKANTSDVTGMQTDIDGKLDIPTQITAGVFTKVTIDTNGLVLSGMDIQASDLPAIAISGITDLQASLDGKAASTDLTALQTTVNGKLSAPATQITAGQGIKFTVDGNGLVTAYEDTLTISDLPLIAVSNIDGLQAALDTKANTTALSTLSATVDGKVNSLGTPTVAGTFAKVTINADGLVTAGEVLAMADLPTIAITDITGLQAALDLKAAASDVTTLQTDLANTTASIAAKADINALVTAYANAIITGLQSKGVDTSSIDFSSITPLT